MPLDDHIFVGGEHVRLGLPDAYDVERRRIGNRNRLHRAVSIGIGNLMNTELERQRDRIPGDRIGIDAPGDAQRLPSEGGLARRYLIDGHVVFGGVLNRRVYKVADGNGYQACPDEKTGPDSHISLESLAATTSRATPNRPNSVRRFSS